VQNALANSGAKDAVASRINGAAQFVEPCFYRTQQMDAGKNIEVTLEVDGGYTCTASLFKPRGMISVFKSAECDQPKGRMRKSLSWGEDDVFLTCPMMPLMSKAGWSEYQVPNTLMREALANSGATETLANDINVDAQLIKPCFYRTKVVQGGANIEVTVMIDGDLTCTVNLFKARGSIAALVDTDCDDS
jgi:hypothetical protein